MLEKVLTLELYVEMLDANGWAMEIHKRGNVATQTATRGPDKIYTEWQNVAPGVFAFLEGRVNGQRTLVTGSVVAYVHTPPEAVAA